MDQSGRSNSENNLLEMREAMPAWLRSNLELKAIVIFETFGAFLLMYGICCSQYLVPIDEHIPNPFHQVFISLALFLAICLSAPFTGGHINPAITLAVAMKKEGMARKTMLTYMLSQTVGAIIGALVIIYMTYLAWNFFDADSAPYTKSGVGFGSLLLDFISYIFGGFFFALFFLIITTKDTTFIQETYWKYLFIPLMLYVCRTFSFRIGCLNPVVGLAAELIQSIYNSEPILLVYSLTMVLGPILGSVLAALFFNRFYRPVYNNWKTYAYSYD